MAETATEAVATEAQEEAPPAQPEPFNGTMAELVHKLRLLAWRREGRWAPVLVEGGFIAAMRVREDFRRELVAKAPGEWDGFEGWARSLREAAKVPARSHGGWTDAQIVKRGSDGSPTTLRWIELYEKEVKPGVARCTDCGGETPWQGGPEVPRCRECAIRGVHDD